MKTNEKKKIVYNGVVRNNFSYNFSFLLIMSYDALPTKLQARSEELEEELEKHKQTLERDFEKTEQDKKDLKYMYNNYVLQVHSLID